MLSWTGSGGLTEAFCGDRYHGEEACQGTKVNGVQGHLHGGSQEDSVDRHLFLLIDFAEDFRVGKAVIPGECKKASGTLREERVGASKTQNDEHGCQEASPDHGLGGVVEYLYERYTSRRHGCPVDVTNAETNGNQENEARDCSDVDRPHDSFRCLLAGVLHLLCHVRTAFKAYHPKA